MHLVRVGRRLKPPMRLHVHREYRPRPLLHIWRRVGSSLLGRWRLRLAGHGRLRIATTGSDGRLRIATTGRRRFRAA